MANCVSGQDEPDPVLLLATQEVKVVLPCPLGTTRCVPQEKFRRKPYNKSFIDQSLFGQDGWILASFCFFRVYGNYRPRLRLGLAWSITHIYFTNSINTRVCMGM